jgi:transcriptional regulator with XRE-family HTH domain
MKIYIDKKIMAINLHNLMDSHRISAEELRREIRNITLNTIKRWRRGYSLPTLAHLILLSNYFNVPIDSFLSYTINRT